MNKWSEKHIEKVKEIDGMFTPLYTTWSEIFFDYEKPEPAYLEDFLDSWDEMIENLCALRSEMAVTENE